MKVFAVVREQLQLGVPQPPVIRWYLDEAAARAWFEGTKLAHAGPDFACFFFGAVVEDSLSQEEVTDLIYFGRREYEADAEDRQVGAAVLAYWAAQGWAMGTATQPRGASLGLWRMFQNANGSLIVTHEDHPGGMVRMRFFPSNFTLSLLTRDGDTLLDQIVFPLGAGRGGFS